jgi:hypothetical protein
VDTVVDPGDAAGAVRATGHPDADPLAHAVAEFIASGAPHSIDRVAQLKVSLARVRPPIWRRVLLPAIAYTYDLGACWEHEITLEKIILRPGGQDYPVCVAFRGDSPIEYWSEEEPEEPSPFGLNEVNRRLAALGRETA